MKQTRLLMLFAALCGVLYMPAACSNNGGAKGGDGDAGDGDVGDGDAGDGDAGDGDAGDGDAGDGGHGGMSGDGDTSTGGGKVVTCDGEGTACESGDNCCSSYCDPATNACSCASAGDDCLSGDDCCSGECNTETKTCALILGTCFQTDTPCGSPVECCSLSCVDGLCSDVQCVQDTAECETDGQCCSGQCVDNACKPINLGQCSSAGNPCLGGGDCCSGLCGDEGYCSIGSSYCVQQNDICSADSECCQGVCTKASGASVGYCSTQTSPGTRCGSKKLAGEICSGDCSECCSRTCAPYGPSGVTICQQPTGCRTDGELCQTANDCCGGNPDSTVPGAGTAQCVKVNASDEVGRCKVGACNPDGAICGSPEAGTAACDGSLSAPNGMKCCGTKQAGWSGTSEDACTVDTLLVPRCSTIVGGCVEEGGDCASASNCCDGRPCVQNSEGRFVCHDPGGSCVESGGPCTADADCCTGTSCIQEPGQATGICGNTTTDTPGTGGGGGTEPCANYGQSCSTAACCSNVPCDSITNTCRYGGG